MNNNIKLLTIKYYGLGNKRYMRSLELTDRKDIFIISPKNLEFIKVKDKDKDLKKDFEDTQIFINKFGVRCSGVKADELI